ncbi:MAG: 3-deoxy-D-manno-octulosonic acid transferase [Muribaculaceae bacterium]|nr:3-deoxy-D-manno-octulosonic acid transferase [Muribaculaceae bacterium]
MAVRMVAKRNPKAAKMVVGQARTFSVLERRIDQSTGGYIWIHASSLGEFEQGRPLIEMIKREHPQQKILLTFFSPSGYEVRRNYKGADVVCYLPFDLPHNVKKFLDIVKPQMAIFIKYEFWGNYLNELKHRGIRTYIISAIFRKSQLFFKPWGLMFRRMLKCYTTLYVQDEQSRALLESIKITNVKITGDTRFDRVTDILAGCTPLPIVEKFTSGMPTLIIGSSWQPDEDIIIPYFNEHPEFKLIIAPHEFSHERLDAIMGRLNRPVTLYTQTNENAVAKSDCLILDCFGILSSAYRYAQIAYIGGGFGAGIHNLNEAAVYGIPVIFGPNYNKFKEAHDLIACQGGFSIMGEEDFARLMARFDKEPDFLAKSGKIAGDYIKSNLGATEKIFKEIM